MTLLQHRFTYSLQHDHLLQALASTDKLLIIQDLDGVCMGLVTDPGRRQLDPNYIRACRQLDGEFFVLTNGEHIGPRGVNGIVDRAFAEQPPDWPQQQGLYLPGLAAGGVQLQDRFGDVSHPGVSDAELAFLQSAPAFFVQRLTQQLREPPFALDHAAIDALLQVIVLSNPVSPTINIGSLFDYWQADVERYRQSQQLAHQLLQELLQQVSAQGLDNAFFIHLAPNLGAKDGIEQLKPGTTTDMGTTDFQFMLRGAVKEVGVIVLLNQYYYERTGEYPLGEDFNARTAPASREALVDLAAQHFDPALMPTLIGVGDTVTSNPVDDASTKADYSRGGSDRGFLTLLQQLGERLQIDSAVLWVDSSGDELNRPGISPRPSADDDSVPLSALQGITDSADALRLNVIFPGGYREYIAFFEQLAARRET